MTVVQRQIWWLGLFLLLLGTTVATLFWLPYRASLLHVVLPLLVVYGWVRFVFVIWKPLYREQVSPGWSVVLFFAGFGIFFMLGIVYRVASGHFE
jgi:lysylphosphatidylglycerol synthetase-like protein (DUF2156 family)